MYSMVDNWEQILRDQNSVLNFEQSNNIDDILESSLTEESILQEDTSDKVSECTELNKLQEEVNKLQDIKPGGYQFSFK